MDQKKQRHNYRLASLNLNELNLVLTRIGLRLDQLDAVGQRPDLKGQKIARVGAGAEDDEAVNVYQLSGKTPIDRTTGQTPAGYLPSNSKNQAGIVSAPGTAGAKKSWICDASGNPAWRERWLTGTLVWDPPNLVDAAGATSAAITVSGAALGDMVLVGAPYDLQGILATAYVSSADTVKIRLQNESGGAINLVEGAWKVAVIQT